MVITANDLKVKGMTLINNMIHKYGEVFVSVRGKNKFVIIPLDEYERLKESELYKAIREAEKDYRKGRYVTESAKEHFKRLGI